MLNKEKSEKNEMKSKWKEWEDDEKRNDIFVALGSIISFRLQFVFKNDLIFI